MAPDIAARSALPKETYPAGRDAVFLAIAAFFVHSGGTLIGASPQYDSVSALFSAPGTGKATIPMSPGFSEGVIYSAFLRSIGTSDDTTEVSLAVRTPDRLSKGKLAPGVLLENPDLFEKAFTGIADELAREIPVPKSLRLPR